MDATSGESRSSLTLTQVPSKVSASVAEKIVVDDASSEQLAVKRDWRFWCIIFSLSICMLLTALEFVSDLHREEPESVR